MRQSVFAPPQMACFASEARRLAQRIAMWSGPCNLSPALMRSFGSRGDTLVSDEPFCGAYLQHTGFDQPLKDAVMPSMETDWHRAAAALSGEAPAPIWQQKHMAHHMTGPIDCGDLLGFAHAFLIRAPERVVTSYVDKGVAVTPDDLGYARQRGGFNRPADRLGHASPVLDASARAVSDACRPDYAYLARFRIGFGENVGVAPG